MLGNSRVSVQSQTDRIEPKSPTLNEIIGDASKSQISNGIKEYPFTHGNYSKKAEAALLRKSKKLLISLIDKELQKVQPSVVNIRESRNKSKQLKMESINKITEELAVLKELEGIYG